jgi:hypothetical protein
MVMSKRSLGSLGVLALCVAAPAAAQDSNTVIGPPQLRDFSISGRREVAAPPPQAQPAPPAQTPPATAQTRTQPPARPAERVAEAPRRAPAPAAAQPAPASPQPFRPSPTVAQPDPEPVTPPPIPAEPTPAPKAAPGPAASWTSYGLYAIPAAAALALLGFVAVRRRRKAEPETIVEAAPGAAAPPRPVAPRPDPIPRPWLELSLRAERASFTDAETELLFELEISNKGGSAARNIRIDVKLFNGGVDQQDKDIGAFFRTAGRDSTKLHLSEVAAGVTGVIQGRVTLAREEMRAVRLDERLLFIPVVAVNALYDWGQGRTGQTSKSYVIGRELSQPSEKMGAFRVDQGPRVWRTVAQRDHSLAKRV